MISAAPAVKESDEQPDYDYFEEDENFSDNPLAQSSSRAPVAKENSNTTTSSTAAIRSANTFNLIGQHQDELFEEADYAEEEDDDEDEDEDDEDDTTTGQVMSSENSTMSRQASIDVQSMAASENNGAGDTNTASSDLRRNIEYFELEPDEEEDEEEDEDDDEYGDDFNDNFVVDYENVDRRTLIKELVNASNALAATNANSKPVTGN